MANSVDLSISGLASGFDWKSFVEQMVQAERAPEAVLRAKQTRIQQRNAAFANLKTQLEALRTQIAALKDPALYDTRTAQSSNTSLATAIAGSGAAVGAYRFDVTQLATASRMIGTDNVGSPLSSTPDVASLTLASAGFSTPISAGTFTVNGKQVTIAAADTLQQVFSKIATATNNAVTADYDSTTDKIILSSTSTIVLGSATDTSNFLQAARLYNGNNTGTISSSMGLGSIRLGSTLTSAGFATALTENGATVGEFKINGVSIQFDISADSTKEILDRINNSEAGVTAAYDSLNDRFLLTSKVTGDVGIALEDVSGHFLAATGLTAGSLEHGKNLLYTIDGGDQLVSQTNTITEPSSGISGLSVTALAENSSFTVTVGSDTAKIRAALQGFVEAYNKIQSYLGTQTASSTDADGVVTAGLLANDSAATEVASGLRATVFSLLNGMSGKIKNLADLGFQTNGYDNKLSLSKEVQLD
ncbi:MAG TPA: flagellar filament capping protein FliD, partial [Clostridia bacterium]|nr:flagellar filament capping protein FliD [Clostridia bacterium]